MRSLFYRCLYLIKYVMSATAPSQPLIPGQMLPRGMVQKVYQCNDINMLISTLLYGNDVGYIFIRNPLIWNQCAFEEVPRSRVSTLPALSSGNVRLYALAAGQESVGKRYLRFGLMVPGDDDTNVFLTVDGNLIRCSRVQPSALGLPPLNPSPATRPQASRPAPPKPKPIMVLPLPDGLDVAKYILAETGSSGIRNVAVFFEIGNDAATKRYTIKITFAVGGGIEIVPQLLKRDTGGCMVLLDIYDDVRRLFRKASEKCGQELNPDAMKLCGEDNKPVLYFGDDRLELIKDYMS